MGKITDIHEGPPKQVCLDELKQSIHKVIEGGDPLDFVNAFFCRPEKEPGLPTAYWQKRICAVAEFLSKVKRKA
jgi:hypothetical protein